jgi:hypothetical protein
LHIGFIFFLANGIESFHEAELPSLIQQVYSNRILILYACGYTIASFGGAVLISYITKSKSERYFGGILERVLVTTLIVLPNSLYLLIPPILILSTLIRRRKLHSLILNTALASIVGVCLRTFV